MPLSTPLPPRPLRLSDLDGRWAGVVTEAPHRHRTRSGRLRTWSYTAAAGIDDEGEPWLFAAAIVAVGPLRTAFVLGNAFGRRIEYSSDLAPPGAAEVGRTPGAGARYWSTLRIDANGGLTFVTDEGWEIESHVVPDTPMIVATPTPEGGWNVTQKCAGERVEVQLRGPDQRRTTTRGVGWRDWTCGRQDTNTLWTWAAGGSHVGRRIGWNLATGMNGAVGEDAVWIDGIPHGVDEVELAPVGQPSGAWTARADGMDLALEPTSSHRLERRVGPWSTSYVKPWGRWRGTIDVAGSPRKVDGHGVAEDHEVRW